MKVLFLHGMGARPKEWQLNVFREHNLDVYALHLVYSKDVNSFEVLRDYIKEKEIEFLVGRSHGGYFAYWLAEELGIPCLMMNPHHSLSLMDKMKPKAMTQRASPLCLLVLGTDDDLVDPDRTVLFFEEEAKKGHPKLLKTKIMDGVGHWLAPDTFSDMVGWALSEIKKLPNYYL